MVVYTSLILIIKKTYMKHKLLYLLLFFSFLGNFTFAQSGIKSNKKTGNSSSAIVSKNKALIPAPLATAGSACKEMSDATVRVFVTASGNSGDIIEWYDSQESTTVLRTGSIYSPFISKTTTFYVQSRSGNDLSVRVPVVASVFNAPPNVTLTVSPTDNPICKGVPLTFTATGGGDLFEFSIDNNIVQAMSTNRVYTTSTLSTGQVVKVKSRYAVTLDGTVSEAAWGTGAFEDNGLSAALSPSAVDGYLTSVKISGTEDKLIFGITGKLNANRSTLIFLDTKPGGFNIGNYGDEVTVNPSVNGFNYFNNNPSTFDSYFLPDYCLAISTKDGGLTYFADIIELKTGTSTKVSLGTASNGNPSDNFGVNNGNTGINDLSLGFEIAVLKSQIGYVTGDIKFFGITMKDDSEAAFSITNSFLSPERTSTLDYGSGPIDFNLRDPKAVVVSVDAFIPCYKEATLSVTIVEKPTTATVGSNQNNCSLTSTSLGGNTPTVGTGKWSVKTGPGTGSFSNINSGSSTVTVDVMGTYVFTWTISNGNCDPSMADINVKFNLPLDQPITSNVTQPTCAIPSGTIVVATQTGVEYSINGSTYQATNTFSGVAPGNYTLYVRNLGDTTCVTPSASTVTINALPLLPQFPTVLNIKQPTCLKPSGSIEITTQPNIQYSVGNGYQDGAEFINLAPGKYTLSVRFKSSIECIVTGSQITINPVPATIQFDVAGECVSDDYILTAKSIANSYDAATVEYIWKDENGQQIGTNASELNVSRVLASKTNQIVYPLTYTLTIKSSATGCETTKSVLINGIYCNIQKGISPDGNGSNEFLDLSLMDVRNLEIFNRYGLKVYSMPNYKNQWKGQTNKGEELPSATYYYVIQFNNGQTKTGWIYLIREK